jgi:biopolymer transport protein ExbB
MNMNPITRIACSLALGLFITTRVGASTNGLDKVILTTQSEIRTALTELNALRETVNTERIPLAETHDKLSQTVREKRQTLKRMLDAQKLGNEAQHTLAANVAQGEAECQFILTALLEYRRGMEARTSSAALQSYHDALRLCDDALAKATELEHLPAATEVLLSLAMQWNQNGIGGRRAAGTALNAAGIEEAGHFFFAGPIAYFANSNRVGGIVLTHSDSLIPTYFDQHTPREQESIANLVAGSGSDSVPLDVTHGDALSIETAGDSLIEQVGKGGFVMFPLLLIGLLAIALTIWKFFELRGMRQASQESLATVISHLDPSESDQAHAAARKLNLPLSMLIEEALTYRDSPREHLEEILHEHILAMVPKLERHLGTLAVFAGIAPLLGLLGTVTGMIHTFDLVSIFGTGEARLLSGGISEALITTKFGLAIAIPVLLVHAFFARRVRTLIGTLESTAVRFVNILKTGTSTP